MDLDRDAKTNFEEDPWASADAELLGALFLAGDNYNRLGWH